MSQPDDSKLLFGYWALRGKVHVTRLVMEHLKIPYEEVVYKTPQSWYEDSLCKNNPTMELPYLKDKDFMIDESIPVLNYVLKKYGHQNFLGASIKDQTYVDMYLWSMETLFRKVIAMSLKYTESVEQLMQIKEELWKRSIEPKLQSIEDFLIPDDWFLGYLTAVDFDLHEVSHYIRYLFPSKVGQFPKIQQIEKKIAELPAIKAYTGTEKYRELCFLPVEMCKRYKSQPQSA